MEMVFFPLHAVSVIALFVNRYDEEKLKGKIYTL